MFIGINSSNQKAGSFRGVYHVLNGLISPADEIGPENINLASLVKRVENLLNAYIIQKAKMIFFKMIVRIFIYNLLSLYMLYSHLLCLNLLSIC